MQVCMYAMHASSKKLFELEIVLENRNNQDLVLTHSLFLTGVQQRKR